MDAIRFPYENQKDPEHQTALARLMNRGDFQELRRPTWLPLTTTGEVRATASKYDGIPWLSRVESWPSCGRCHRAIVDRLALSRSEALKELTGSCMRSLAGRLHSLKVVWGHCVAPPDDDDEQNEQDYALSRWSQGLGPRLAQVAGAYRGGSDRTLTGS
jgi:hypothetical protein